MCLLFAIIIFILLNFFISQIDFYFKNRLFNTSFIVENNFSNQSLNSDIQFNNNNNTNDKNLNINNTNSVENENSINENVSDFWYLEIPSINLKANIEEGTTKEIMDNYIGHFEETSKSLGNIGLAAHNRGYKNNYFENLKKLKQGDKIIYRYNDFSKIYIVEKHEIIKDTDWTMLESTEENKITLITCVENEPEYRRCIQGIEEKAN